MSIAWSAAQFGVLFATAVLCLSSPADAAPLSRQEAAAQDKLVAEEQAKLQSCDAEVRLEAFWVITAPLRTHDGAGPIDPERATLTTRLAVSDLLRRHVTRGKENFCNPNFPPPGAEDDGLPDLMQAVLELHDPSSIPLLWTPDVLTSGAMATDALAYFGKSEAPRVISTFSARPCSSTDLIRDSLGQVILSMLRQQTIDDRATLRQVNALLIEQSYARLPGCRWWAVRGLAYFPDDRSQARLREIAATDPFTLPPESGRGPSYLVREAAKTIVDTIQKQSSHN